MRETKLHPDSLGMRKLRETESRLNNLTELDITPTLDMPGMWFMSRHKIHRSERLADGFWHYYRFSNADRAAEEDMAMSGPMLAKGKL